MELQHCNTLSVSDVFAVFLIHEAMTSQKETETAKELQSLNPMVNKIIAEIYAQIMNLNTHSNTLQDIRRASKKIFESICQQGQVNNTIVMVVQSLKEDKDYYKFVQLLSHKVVCFVCMYPIKEEDTSPTFFRLY